MDVADLVRAGGLNGDEDRHARGTVDRAVARRCGSVVFDEGALVKSLKLPLLRWLVAMTGQAQTRGAFATVASGIAVRRVGAR